MLTCSLFLTILPNQTYGVFVIFWNHAHTVLYHVSLFWETLCIAHDYNLMCFTLQTLSTVVSDVWSNNWNISKISSDHHPVYSLSTLILLWQHFLNSCNRHCTASIVQYWWCAYFMTAPANVSIHTCMDGSANLVWLWFSSFPKWALVKATLLELTSSILA